MKIVTVPNWSISNRIDILHECKKIIGNEGLNIHSVESDIDHNRTVTAFSGDLKRVFSCLKKITDIILPEIDLRNHKGVHPRIGALDVCPFITENNEFSLELNNNIELFSTWLTENYNIPVFLYEHSAKNTVNSQLPELRKGGFEHMLHKSLQPDFGPELAHPKWGASIIGQRSDLVAMNVLYAHSNHLHVQSVVKELSRQIRQLREAGEPNFQGVRSLFFWLDSRKLAQISINITKPAETNIDQLIDFCNEFTGKHCLLYRGSELIGTIRDNFAKSSYLNIEDKQICFTNDAMKYQVV